jgi:hypothetical protein
VILDHVAASVTKSLTPNGKSGECCSHCAIPHHRPLSHQSNHINSVHRKRYPCRIPGCLDETMKTPRFGLTADLRRHQHSAHPDIFDQHRLPCPVSTCQTQLTHRRDNARRHLMQVHGLKRQDAETVIETSWNLTRHATAKT